MLDLNRKMGYYSLFGFFTGAIIGFPFDNIKNYGPEQKLTYNTFFPIIIIALAITKIVIMQLKFYDFYFKFRIDKEEQGSNYHSNRSASREP